MEEKFTGATGEMAEMFSCLWPSECTLHRVTPNSDLTEYIVDTEIYTEPASVSKPISGWYIDQDARFSTNAVANLWEVAYASTTVGAKQTVSKTRAFEESPVDQIFVEPTKFRAEYIYSIPKSAWDAAKTAGSL